MIVALPWPFIRRGLFVGVSSAFCCMGEVVSFDCGAPWAFHRKGSLRRGSPLLFVAWERLCHLIVALPWPFIRRGLFVGVSYAFCCMGEVVSFNCGAPLAFHYKKESLCRGFICFLLHGRGCVI